MEINKTIFERLKNTFTLEQPIHKIKRSRKTMIGFISTMLISQFCLQAFVFPFMIDESIFWLKTTICIVLATWALFGLIFQALGPGIVKQDSSVSLMDLLDEFDVREVCFTCKVIVLPRSRHCNICQVCVDRFDHHCQWLNNCVGSRNHGYFLVFVFTQTIYLFLVAGALVSFYIDQIILRHHETHQMISTCGTPTEHLSDLCFIAQQDLLSDKNSKIVIHIIDALIFFLSIGFAFPVLQLFILQSRNFLAGQTSIERLGKQQGKKVELTTLFNVKEPLLNNNP